MKNSFLKNRSKKFGGGVLASLPKILFVAVLLFSSSLAFAKDKDLQNMSDENLNKILQGLGVPMDAKTLKALDAEMEDEEEEEKSDNAQVEEEVVYEKGHNFVLPKNVKIVCRKDGDTFIIIKIGEKYWKKKEDKRYLDGKPHKGDFFKKQGSKYLRCYEYYEPETGGYMGWRENELDYIESELDFAKEIFLEEMFGVNFGMSIWKSNTQKIAGRLCTKYTAPGGGNVCWVDSETGLVLKVEKELIRSKNETLFEVTAFDTKVKSFGKIELPPKW